MSVLPAVGVPVGVLPLLEDMNRGGGEAEDWRATGACSSCCCCCCCCCCVVLELVLGPKLLKSRAFMAAGQAACTA